MRLILSSHNPRDSLYSTEAGQNLYKVDKSGSGVTTVRKAVREPEGHFASYAEVEFHTFRSTRFRYNDIDVSVDDYFRKEGLFNPGRVFKASDGLEYHWKLDGRYLEMFRHDGSKKKLVKFREHRSSFDPLITDKPASLDVDDSCIAILDEIILTFVYCQKQRKDGQASGAAGTGNASAPGPGVTAC